MSRDKYPSIFLHQMKAIVCLYHVLQNMVIMHKMFGSFIFAFYLNFLSSHGICYLTIETVTTATVSENKPVLIPSSPGGMQPDLREQQKLSLT